MGFVVVEARAVGVDERTIDDRAGCRILGLEQQFPEPLEQGHIAAEANLQELVGHVDAAADHTGHLLGILESFQPASGRGLIAMIRAPFALAFSSVESMRG